MSVGKLLTEHARARGLAAVERPNGRFGVGPGRRRSRVQPSPGERRERRWSDRREPRRDLLGKFCHAATVSPLLSLSLYPLILRLVIDACIAGKKVSLFSLSLFFCSSRKLPRAYRSRFSRFILIAIETIE